LNFENDNLPSSLFDDDHNISSHHLPPSSSNLSHHLKTKEKENDLFSYQKIKSYFSSISSSSSQKREIDDQQNQQQKDKNNGGEIYDHNQNQSIQENNNNLSSSSLLISKNQSSQQRNNLVNYEEKLYPFNLFKNDKSPSNHHQKQQNMINHQISSISSFHHQKDKNFKKFLIFSFLDLDLNLKINWSEFFIMKSYFLYNIPSSSSYQTTTTTSNHNQKNSKSISTFTKNEKFKKQDEFFDFLLIFKNLKFFINDDIKIEILPFDHHSFYDKKNISSSSHQSTKKQNEIFGEFSQNFLFSNLQYSFLKNFEFLFQDDKILSKDDFISILFSSNSTTTHHENNKLSNEIIKLIQKIFISKKKSKNRKSANTKLNFLNSNQFLKPNIQLFHDEFYNDDQHDIDEIEIMKIIFNLIFYHSNENENENQILKTILSHDTPSSTTNQQNQFYDLIFPLFSHLYQPTNQNQSNLSSYQHQFPLISLFKDEIKISKQQKNQDEKIEMNDFIIRISSSSSNNNLPKNQHQQSSYSWMKFLSNNPYIFKRILVKYHFLSVSSSIKFQSEEENVIFEMIDNDYKKTKEKLDFVMKMRWFKKFVCLNDNRKLSSSQISSKNTHKNQSTILQQQKQQHKEQEIDNFQSISQLLADFYLSIFPTKSSFEK